MATLVLSEITDLALDRAQVNVAVDAPVSTAEMLRHVNDVYSDVWNISGGGVAVALSSVIWAGSPTTGGTLTGSATSAEIEEPIQVWACLTDTTSPDPATDFALDTVEYSRILYERGQSGSGVYGHPKLAAFTRVRATTDATVGRIRLDVHPAGSPTTYYYPLYYVPQFQPLNGTTIVTPDVNDIESRDIALLVAMRIAPLVGRAELVPSIAADVSQRTKEALERKFSAMLYGKQDQ